ncbi:MAG: sodium transporter [Chlorobiaceae bacterium]|nr:sodium transporter [Chlorobiaceae bacterium]MBA4309423.1 sodium transporter [Chlorobiaceae bacterium]
MTGYLGTFDLITIIIYFIIIFSIGYYFARKEKTSKDYFLAGRNVGWIAIGASLFATNISSEHFIGLAGSGASSGFAVGQFELLACFILMLLGWVFAPFYLRSSVFTMPEFLEKRYSPATRVYLSWISIVGYILTKISISLFAGAILLREVVGWDFYTSAIVLVIATGIYTIAGGLAAVIYTEVVQTFVLIFGAVLLTVLGLNEVGWFTGLSERLPADYFDMFKAASHPDFPWTGIIFGAPILGIWYWCTDQFIVQRVLSAKNLDHAQRGTILAGYLKILPLFILVLPGMIAKALYPTEVTGDNAYPILLTNLLPEGLRGIVIAGLLAALMSSLSAVFNSCSTLITVDLYKRKRPDASEKTLVRIGRYSTALLVVLGLLWVPLIKHVSGQMFVYLQSVQAYISPPIAAIFIFGITWQRVNAKGALASLITGFVLGMSRLVLEILNKSGNLHFAPLQYIAEINFLHFAIILFAICSSVLIAVSLATAPPTYDKLRGITFAYPERDEAESNPIWKRTNIIFSVLLVLIVFALWLEFS